MVASMGVEPVSRSDQYKRVMKPLLERKRRARINHCLDELRDLLVSVLQSEGEAVTRLEKADILELTVRHVRKLSQSRRLALPQAGSVQQQEDAVKFQQGFVAAAHQVHSFLMSTPLEPSVSSGLLSHLTNCATSIVPPQTPSPSPSSPAHSNTPHPQSPSPPNYPPTARSISPAIPPRLPSVSLSIPPPTTSYPLVDLSNRHPSPNQMRPPQPQLSQPPQPQPIRQPIIRDVKLEDRTVAPSPFIDVVSTEETKSEFKNYSKPSDEFKSQNYSYSKASVRHTPYHLPKKLAAASARQAALPQDLSMKKPSDGEDSKWRPW